MLKVCIPNESGSASIMRCHSACFIASCVLFIAVAFPAYAHSQQTQLNTIALSGSTGTSLGFGPNLNSDDSFTGFGLPELNASGQVAFGASETGSSRVFNGIWTNVGVSLKLTVNGVNLSPILNSSGSLGFYSSLTVGSTSGTGLWTTSTGVLAPIALAGTQHLGQTSGRALLSLASIRRSITSTCHSVLTVRLHLRQEFQAPVLHQQTAVGCGRTSTARCMPSPDLALTHLGSASR